MVAVAPICVSAPTIRYFDLFLLIDNEKGTFTEFPEAAEIKATAA
jgi:hypothetical protein